MNLTSEEKEIFLSHVRNLTEMDVITKEVRDQIYRVLMVACNNALGQV